MKETPMKKYSKSDLRYWKDRVYQGKGASYCCAFQHQGRRMWLSLHESDQSKAAQRAKDINASLDANGWEPTLAKYRTGGVAEPKNDLTIGQYLDAVRKNCALSGRTITGYESSLRQIVSDVFKFDDVGNRYDYMGGGRDVWLKAVHSVKLAALTPAKVQQWKIAYLREHSTSPITERRAKITASTTLRQAKSLFGPKVIGQLSDVQLPSPLPFAGVKGFERQDTKYHGGLDIEKLVQAAQTELDPETFKIFALGLMAGLRRKEIDLLEWPSFRWNESAIQIRETNFFKAKSKDSYGVVQVDPELIEIFRGYHARATGSFVIEGREPISAKWNRYRCQPHFNTLCSWLRNHGVKSGSPIHTLRKELGSQICAKAGIYAASVALRHSDINVTTKFYTDRGPRVVSGFGQLLTPPNVVQMKKPPMLGIDFKQLRSIENEIYLAKIADQAKETVAKYEAEVAAKRSPGAA